MSLKTNLYLADENDKQYVRPQSFGRVRLCDEIHLYVRDNRLIAFVKFHFLAGVIA